MAVVLKGLAETLTAFRAFLEAVEDIDTIQDLGSKIVNRATALAPIRSGALSASITSEPQKGGVKIYAGSDSVPYAGVIEYGWPQRGRAAKPYLPPAVKEYSGEIARAYEDGIKQAIFKYNLQ
jgi:hypothetical protein